MELRTLMNEQRHAVDLYRDGHIDEALALMRARTGSMNEAIAERILRWLDDPAPQLRDPKRQLVQHWTPALVAALGALHMEMALRIYTGRGGVDSFHFEVHTARRLFEAAAKGNASANDLLPRWILAIASTAHADGQLWWAAAIIDDACRTDSGSADLLVACGAVHETIAGFPAHLLLSEGRHTDDEARVGFAVDTAQVAVAARGRQLRAARRMLENALKVSSSHVEARLRLARVLALTGEVERGATLLEPIVRDDGRVDRRSAFLARLLLGMMRQQLGATSAAISLFEECIRLVPSAQSAYVALAHALHGSGKVREAAAITEQMLNAQTQPPDPWGNYPFGQYWIAEPLLQTLRAEARK